EIKRAMLPADSLSLPGEDALYARFFWIRCNHSENVMSAWALGPSEKAAIIVQFLAEIESKMKRTYVLQLQTMTGEIREIEKIRAFSVNPKRDVLPLLDRAISLQRANAILGSEIKALYDVPQRQTQGMKLNKAPEKNEEAKVKSDNKAKGDEKADA